MTDTNLIVLIASIYSAGFVVEALRSYKDWRDPNALEKMMRDSGVSMDKSNRVGMASMRLGMYLGVFGIPLFWPAQKLFKLFMWAVFGRVPKAPVPPEDFPSLDEMPPLEPLDDSPLPVPALLRKPLLAAAQELKNVDGGEFLDLTSIQTTVRATFHFNLMRITFTTHDAGDTMEAAIETEDGVHCVMFEVKYNHETDKPIIVWEKPDNPHLHRAVDVCVMLAVRTFQRMRAEMKEDGAA